GDHARRPRALRRPPRGFRLIGRRFGRVALVWLILVGVSIGLGIGLAVAYLIVLIPLGLLVFAAYAAGHTVGLIAGLALAGLVFLVVAFVLAGAVGAFTSTYWTLAYRRLELEALPAA